MKIQIDTNDILTTPRSRTIAWVLLFIAAAILIFQLGVICGAHRHFRHHGFGAYGQDQQFNVRFSNGGQAQGQDVIYYGSTGMMGGYGSASAQPARMMNFQQGGAW